MFFIQYNKPFPEQNISMHNIVISETSYNTLPDCWLVGA